MLHADPIPFSLARSLALPLPFPLSMISSRVGSRRCRFDRAIEGKEREYRSKSHRLEDSLDSILSLTSPLVRLSPDRFLFEHHRFHRGFVSARLEFQVSHLLKEKAAAILRITRINEIKRDIR